MPIARGLGMVHQHFMLVKPFTVAENIVLGQRSPRAPLLEAPRTVHKRLAALSDQYGLAIDPAAEVWTLSVGEQQRVEILKALYRGADVLILDEPTAVLTPQEWTGCSIFCAAWSARATPSSSSPTSSAKVLAASNRITVMRDGEVVGTVPTDEPTSGPRPHDGGPRGVLRVSEGSGAPAETRAWCSMIFTRATTAGCRRCRGINLEVRSGEILGIAGVAGNGQTELEEAIAGLRRPTVGKILICGQDTTHASPRAISDAGLAHVPSDRYRMGMLGDFSVAENLVLQTRRQSLPSRVAAGWITERSQQCSD